MYELQKKDSRIKRREDIVGGNIVGIIVIVMIFMLSGVMSGCKSEFITNIIKGNREKIVGQDIAAEEITKFYYTYAASTYPPEYQRYQFYIEDGKYQFYHEKREGKNWPLTEDKITVSGLIELSEEEWQQLMGYLKDGKVKKREESLDTGGSKLSLYLYWEKDQSKYQQFSFASNDLESSFEEFCIMLSVR